MRSSLLSPFFLLLGLSTLPACTVNYYVPAATNASVATNSPRRQPQRPGRWQQAPGPNYPGGYYPAPSYPGPSYPAPHYPSPQPGPTPPAPGPGRGPVREAPVPQPAPGPSHPVPAPAPPQPMPMPQPIPQPIPSPGPAPMPTPETPPIFIPTPENEPAPGPTKQPPVDPEPMPTPMPGPTRQPPVDPEPAPPTKEPEQGPAPTRQMPVNDETPPIFIPAPETTKTDGGPNAPGPLNEAPQQVEPVLAFSRTSCFGTCPDFTARFFADGRVEYEGRQFAPVQGQRLVKIDPAIVRQLLREAEQLSFFQLRERYTTGAVDVPSTILTITTPQGQTKRVQVEENAPAALLQLFAHLDQAVLNAVGSTAK